MNRNMCTHPTMERIQANGQTCDICGKVPSMNFLYLCAQDTGRETIREIMERNQNTPVSPESKPAEASVNKGKSVPDESALDALKGKAVVKKEAAVDIPEDMSMAEENPTVDASIDKGKGKYVLEETSSLNSLMNPSSINTPKTESVPEDSVLDALKGKSTTTAHPAPNTQSAPTTTTSPPTKSDLRLRLERIGLSESVISTAEAGGYTSGQLTRLIAMKENVTTTITAQTQPRPSSFDALFSRLSALADSGSASKPKQMTDVRRSPPELQGLGAGANESQFGPCGLKACHTCRPYFRDWTWLSLDAVANGEYPPLTAEQVARLPVHDAAVMRTIGLAVPPEVVGEVDGEEGSVVTTSSGEKEEEEEEEDEDEEEE